MQVFDRNDMVLRPRVRGAMSRPREVAWREHGIERASRAGHRIGAALRRHAAGVGRRAIGGAVRNLRATQAVEAANTARTLATRARFLNPATIAIAAVVVAGLVVTRLATGRSFENMGENLKQVVLGPMTAEAAASTRAREELLGNDGLMAMVSPGSSAMDQSAFVARITAAVNRTEQIGRDAIAADKAFQTNGTLDLMILRFAELMKKSWESAGTKSLLDEVARRLGNLIIGYNVQFVLGWLPR